MVERAVRVIVKGRVQGVGFRAWTTREAEAHGLAGWVRNRADGSVEAVFAGEADAVAAMIAACRGGPRMAQVTGVETAGHREPVGPGFRELPTH